VVWPQPSLVMWKSSISIFISIWSTSIPIHTIWGFNTAGVWPHYILSIWYVDLVPHGCDHIISLQSVYLENTKLSLVCFHSMCYWKKKTKSGCLFLLPGVLITAKVLPYSMILDLRILCGFNTAGVWLHYILSIWYADLVPQGCDHIISLQSTKLSLVCFHSMCYWKKN